MQVLYKHIHRMLQVLGTYLNYIHMRCQLPTYCCFFLIWFQNEAYLWSAHKIINYLKFCLSGTLLVCKYSQQFKELYVIHVCVIVYKILITLHAYLQKVNNNLYLLVTLQIILIILSLSYSMDYLTYIQIRQK